jgi:hypothetical protein
MNANGRGWPAFAKATAWQALKNCAVALSDRNAGQQSFSAASGHPRLSVGKN